LRFRIQVPGFKVQDQRWEKQLSKVGFQSFMCKGPVIDSKDDTFTHKYRNTETQFSIQSILAQFLLLFFHGHVRFHTSA
jgi:hypothetical protein